MTDEPIETSPITLVLPVILNVPSIKSVSLNPTKRPIL